MKKLLLLTLLLAACGSASSSNSNYLETRELKFGPGYTGYNFRIVTLDGEKMECLAIQGAGLECWYAPEKPIEKK